MPKYTVCLWIKVHIINPLMPRVQKIKSANLTLIEFIGLIFKGSNLSQYSLLWVTEVCLAFYED